MSRQTECIESFLKRAQRDQTVYITDVRRIFDEVGEKAFHVHAHLYEGAVEVFGMSLPEWETEAQREFVAEYVRAFLYNLISTLGAIRIEIYLDPADEGLRALAEGLREDFQLDLDKTERSGYGKCLNVNERIVKALTGGKESLLTLHHIHKSHRHAYNELGRYPAFVYKLAQLQKRRRRVAYRKYKRLFQLRRLFHRGDRTRTAARLRRLRHVGVAHEAVYLYPELCRGGFVDAGARHIGVRNYIASAAHGVERLLYRALREREVHGVIEIRRTMYHALYDSLVFLRYIDVKLAFDDLHAARFDFFGICYYHRLFSLYSRHFS